MKAMKGKIKGIAWKFGDNVDTDQIIPAEYLTTADEKELGKHAFAKVLPEFAEKVKEGDLIVAGENFGSGSSREHAVRALKGAGISVVIAKSFARIFFRNAINLGLVVIESDIEAENGDIIEIDFENAKIKNITRKKEADFKKIPEFLLEILNEGGLIKYAEKVL